MVLNFSFCIYSDFDSLVLLITSRFVFMQLKPLLTLIIFMWVLVGCDKPPMTKLEHVQQKRELKVGTLAGPA